MEKEKTTELNLIDLADDLLILNRRTIETLLQFENCADCIALYIFYYKTAKWQKTNSIKACDEYVMKSLKWGKKKTTQTKKTLKECGLIEIVQRRKNKKITGWYIQVNYVISEKKIEDINIKIEEETEKEEPTSTKSKEYQKQQVPKATSSFQNTNAINKNIKCLKIKYKMLKNKKESVKEKTLKRFSPPTLEEVRAYCLEKNINVDPERFIDHYTSNGWKVGRNPMKDWKAAVRNWGRSDFDHKKQATTEPESKYREMDDLDLAYIRAVEDLNRSLGGGVKNG